MKFLLLFTLSVALPVIPATAAPCAPGTLSSYIALGSAGCTLGNLQVEGFTYQAKATGGAAEIKADQITVTPLLAPVGSYALQFAAPWGVESNQGQLSGITYRVLSPTPTVQVQQVRLDGTGFEAGLFGSVVVNQAMATPVAALDLKIYLQCEEVCRSQTSSPPLSITPSTPALVVADQVTLKSKAGNAALTGFTDWFVVCMACV